MESKELEYTLTTYYMRIILYTAASLVDGLSGSGHS